jgi:hypothetical protein
MEGFVRPDAVILDENAMVPDRNTVSRSGCRWRGLTSGFSRPTYRPVPRSLGAPALGYAPVQPPRGFRRRYAVRLMRPTPLAPYSEYAVPPSCGGRAYPFPGGHSEARPLRFAAVPNVSEVFFSPISQALYRTFPRKIGALDRPPGRCAPYHVGVV